MTAFELFGMGELARVSTLRLADCLIEGTVITIFAALMLRLARGQGSASRFAVWFAALVAIAALPLMGRGVMGQPDSGPGGSAGVFTLPGSLAAYVFAGWSVIAGFGLFRVAGSLWHLLVLRKGCVEIDRAALDARVRQTLAAQAGAAQAGGRPIAFCTSERVNVPTAIGLVSPAVVIPAWVLDELSPEELNQILLHELAHLRRWDDWTNLAQKLVKAVFFFHPAVWWIEKEISLEREKACDDAVVEATASPRAYAECLTHLAERSLIQRSLLQRGAALAQAALGKIRQTTHRVAAILDFERNENRPARMGWKPAAALMAGFAVLFGVGFSRTPRLIGFSDASRISLPAIASSTDIGLPTGVKMIPASFSSSFSSSAPSASSSAPSAPTVRIRPTQLKVPAHRAKHSLTPRVPAPLTAMLPEIPELPIETLLRRASFIANRDVPVGFTETFFVVILGNENDFPNRPDFQIQMWRVMVLHPVVEPDSNRIPAKKT